MTDYISIETGLTLTAKTADSAALVVTLDLSDADPFLSERGAYRMNEKKLIFGLGKKRTPSAIRNLGGDVIRRLVKAKINDAAIEFPEGMTDSEIGAFLEGLLLGAFAFERYKGEKTAGTLRVSVNPKFAALVAEKNALCAAVNMARDWAHEPKIGRAHV